MDNNKTEINELWTDFTVEDAVEETFNMLTDNFNNIDKLLIKEATTLRAELVSGKFYENGYKLWKKNLKIGDYVGWVNVREGVYAETWISNKKYNVGMTVSPKTATGFTYVCTQDGTSVDKEPVFPVSNADEFEDLTDHRVWENNYAYSIGDIIVRTNGNKDYYYRCLIDGYSGATEPNWHNTVGATIVDNSVTWSVFKTVKWKRATEACEFREFGKIV